MNQDYITKSEFYGESFSEEQITLISSGQFISCMTLENEKGYYNFHGATIGTLIINAKSITVKNVNIQSQLILSSNVNNCTFENVYIESELQPVVFNSQTWATLFDRCTFIGKGSAISGCAMNAGYTSDGKAINDTLNVMNCHFENYNCIIDIKRGLNCAFTGGECKNVNYAIYNDGMENGVLTNAGTTLTAVFNGFNFNTVKNVIYSAPTTARNYGDNNKIYTQATIVINAIKIIAENSIIHYEAGWVNLECNIPMLSTTKLFSDSSPYTRYCNIKQYGERDYKYLFKLNTYKVKVYLLPGEIAHPFGNINVFKIDWGVNEYEDDGKIKFYVNNTRISVGDAWNMTGITKIHNTDSVAREVEINITTYNAISTPQSDSTIV